MAAFKNKDNGTWYVQFRYTDWRGERQQKLKRGFPTKKAALAWEREFLMKKQADLNMTLESFVELYTQDVKPKLKLNTWLTKESIIQKKILPYLGKRKLSEITPQDIFCWQNEIRKITDKQGNHCGIILSGKAQSSIWLWRTITSGCKIGCSECSGWTAQKNSTLPLVPNRSATVWKISWSCFSKSILTPDW